MTRKQARSQIQPADLIPWLFDNESLTRRLINASGNNLGVRVLNQHYAKPLLCERRTLETDGHQKAYIREVLLMGNGRPWVYARTVIPLSTMTGRLQQLKRLDDKPLGAFLFSFPNMYRKPMQFAKIADQHHVVPQELLDSKDSCWGRRSVFCIDHKTLLVNEIFLPEFVRFISTAKQGPLS